MVSVGGAFALPATSRVPAPAGPGITAERPADLQDQDEADLVAERREADRLRRRGETAKALRTLNELVSDDPKDAASRILRARVRLDECDWPAARKDLERALVDVAGLRDAAAARAWTAECLRALLFLEHTLGRAAEADRLAKEHGAGLFPDGDARDAWALAGAAAGRPAERLELLRRGAASTPTTWEQWLARARCERALGDLEAASRSLVTADGLAASGDGVEPAVLAELAAVYFEADGEIAHPEAQGRQPGVLYKQALGIDPRNEEANLGLYRLNRFNWNRQSRPADEILAEWLRARPSSIEGLLAGAAADLDDGQLPAARTKLARLSELAPGRRETRTLEAALAWIEHREDDCRAKLARLAEEDPTDGAPEREVGRVLCELYRFAEGKGFLERAVARDARDPLAWTELGRAQANTGDEDAARASLAKATELAAGRQNAWRFNMSMVLERMHTRFVARKAGEHNFLWTPDASRVLEAYLVPFYASAREELASRYGFTPGPVQIEVFDRHRDFSVRSTGFEGFPALGVCFGPVVTAVSPTAEMRGQFSWSRTAFHEFTHVIHLGLSHNRCPRWITEGLATWEEEHRDPSWTRNLRRELLDSRASGDLFGVRDLNRAFRTNRILFAYYQSGLWCRMMIERYGFASMVRLLEAFDRGADLDGALSEVFGVTPEQLDRRFEEFVDRELAGLRIEPRWSAARLARLELELSAEAPKDPERRARWIADTESLAAGRWQQGSRIDAEQALRRLDAAGVKSARAAFVRGEIAIASGDKARAKSLWEEGLALGGEDFRARFALGTLARNAADLDAAERHFAAAEKAFPGYDEPAMSAELALAELYERQDRKDDAMAARSRWLDWNSGEYDLHVRVAAWHAEAGRAKEAEALYAEANEVDPFRRKLHEARGALLLELGRHADALREFEVAVLVPPELDADQPGPLSAERRAELLAHQAECLLGLSRASEAAERIRQALELDPESEAAKSVRSRIP